MGKKEYIFGKSVKYIQWKTIFKEDGAYKHLGDDPQDVNIINGKSIVLPKTWNNRRLGHNLSIQWVVDQLKRIKPS